MDELNEIALENFVYQPVSRDMIRYLARVASSVIVCDSAPTTSSRSQSRRELPPTPPRSPSEKYSDMPSLEEFITNLVVHSNVQVPTLMSTLVYLGRLKSKLQPMARGLRCTTHRIFLAALILSAKYLNDSSPKNKHWAKYTVFDTEAYQWAFSRTEVNLMEHQLLLLLEWDLRITEEDLYRELDDFLEPLRLTLIERQERKIREFEERRRLEEACAAAQYASFVESRSSSVSRQMHGRSSSTDSTPGLAFSSSASSCASSVNSRAATPEYEDVNDDMDHLVGHEVCDSPVEVLLDDVDVNMPKAVHIPQSKQKLPYEVTEAELSNKRHMRGVFGRLLSAAHVVR